MVRSLCRTRVAARSRSREASTAAYMVVMAVTSADEVGGGGGGAVATAHLAVERAEKPGGDPRCRCSWCCAAGESSGRGPRPKMYEAAATGGMKPPVLQGDDAAVPTRHHPLPSRRRQSVLEVGPLSLKVVCVVSRLPPLLAQVVLLGLEVINLGAEHDRACLSAVQERGQLARPLL
jgi:hypothetical protein